MKSLNTETQKCTESVVRMIEIISICQSGINDISHPWGSKNLPAALSMSFTSLLAQLVKNPPAKSNPGFNPWVGTIPWRRERLPIPIFWPREFLGLYSPWGCKESGMTEQLSLSLYFLYSDALTAGTCGSWRDCPDQLVNS